MKHFHTKFRRLILLQSLLFALFLSPKSSTAAITPSLVPARTSGVAPLSVFFDASGTTDSTYTTRPFHDLEYTWNFGDVNAGTWAYGAQPGANSKNTATGPVAAHVFETPGVYTVTLRVYNGTDSVTTSTTITVDDPETVFSGSNTICFSNDSDFSGCPTGAVQVTTSDFITAINTYALTGKRVLFMRGDTFTTNANTGYAGAALTHTGPGIVGAFGTVTAPAPVMQMTGNGGILYLSSPQTPTISDWRITDLDFDGRATYSTAGTSLASVGIAFNGGIREVLIMNMTIRDIYRGVHLSDGILNIYNLNGYGSPNQHTAWDQISIVNSILTPNSGTTTSYRIFASARRLAVLGNVLGNISSNIGMGSHTIRTGFIGKGVISDNTIARAGTSAFPSALAIKMHGPCWCTSGSSIDSNTGGCITKSSGYSLANTVPPMGVSGDAGGYTEQVILSSNKIIGADAGELVTLGPQNIYSDERIRDIIVERNWFQAGNNRTQFALVIHSTETTVRNNMFNMTEGSGGGICSEIKLYGPSPAPLPDNIRIYNNTAYKGNGTGLDVVRVDTNSSNVTVRNNLAYAPYATNPRMLIGTGKSGIIQSNNSAVTPVNQIKNTFPNWISTTPSNPADFKLTDSSYAINAGVEMPGVFHDFSNNLRTGTPDMGAFEWKCYSPSAQTLSVCAGQAVTVGNNIYTATGTYTDVLTTASGCDSIVSTSLTVNGVDTATSTSGATITANATGATYQWIDCDNANAPIAGATNQTYTVTASGNYAVIVTQNNCSDTSSCITVNATTTKEIISAKNVSVYPNPSNGQFKTELELNSKAQVIICNTLGETIYKAQVQQGKQEINISDFANGIYILKVFNNEQQQYVRIVKQ